MIYDLNYQHDWLANCIDILKVGNIKKREKLCAWNNTNFVLRPPVFCQCSRKKSFCIFRRPFHVKCIRVTASIIISSYTQNIGTTTYTETSTYLPSLIEKWYRGLFCLIEIARISPSPQPHHAANAENWKYLDSIVLCSCNTAASFWAQGFSKSLNTNERLLRKIIERNNQKMIRKVKDMRILKKRLNSEIHK